MKTQIKKNIEGFTYIEMIVTLALTVVFFAAAGTFFTTGVTTWQTGDSNIRLQESLRFALERIAVELRQSDVSHTQINDGLGLGSSDAITFSIPIRCNSNSITLCERDCDLVTAGDQKCLRVCEWEEITGNENFIWGAPLTWQCAQPDCMDADNNCATFDYKYIRYWINGDGNLQRLVLDSSGVVVSTETLMSRLTDLQFSLNGLVMTINVTAQETGADRRVRTAQTSLELYLRN